MRRSRGFTLIELLVVIAIIGLLAAVVLASVNEARKRGNDAKRISDLKQIQLALEFYFDVNETYPATPTSALVSNMGSTLVPTYLPALPSDPVPTRPNSSGNMTNYNYRYYAGSGQKSYTLLMRMETKHLDSPYWCYIGTEPGNSSAKNAANNVACDLN